MLRPSQLSSGPNLLVMRWRFEACKKQCVQYQRGTRFSEVMRLCSKDYNLASLVSHIGREQLPGLANGRGALKCHAFVVFRRCVVNRCR